jgi:hypothetical protein
MKIIAHRGNVFGPNLKEENSEEYILKAISAGLDVEVDVWEIDNKLYLGHDEPTYLTSKDFLYKISQSAWFHAKNINALNFLLSNLLHCFTHDKDEATLTSQGFIWTNVGKKLINPNISVMVMPELSTKQYFDQYKNNVMAICTDYASEYYIQTNHKMLNLNK